MCLFWEEREQKSDVHCDTGKEVREILIYLPWKWERIQMK